MTSQTREMEAVLEPLGKLETQKPQIAKGRAMRKVILRGMTILVLAMPLGKAEGQKEYQGYGDLDGNTQVYAKRGLLGRKVAVSPIAGLPHAITRNLRRPRIIAATHNGFSSVA